MPYDRLSAADQSALLRQIVERCSSSFGGVSPVVVFDLDGTLMDNRPRTCAILRELGEAWRQREPAAAERLLDVGPSELEYLLTASLAKLGVERMDLLAEAEVFWRDRFFTDAYLKYDVPVAGAAEFARACYEAGGVLAYFTGRDLPLMGLGSFASLRDLGFPIGVAGTELVLKPDAAMSDEAFKRMEGPRLARVGRVAAVFDNEPGNCNVLLEHYRDALSVLVDTQHLPGAPAPLPGVRIIGDFAT